MSERVRGLAAALSTVDALPAAVRHEVADALGPIGRDVLAGQQRDVARKTGHLQSGLSLQLAIEELRVRVGLLGSKAGRSDRFYGRVVEGGRRAQTVAVTRRLRRKIRQKRVEKGRYAKGGRSVIYDQGREQLRRRGPNKGTRVGSAYRLRVRALAARPFVHKDRPELRAEDRLAEALDRAIARSGRAA